MFNGLRGRRGAVLTAVTAVLGGAAAVAPAAQARVVSPSYCAADASLSQPFTAWGDANEYRLVAGGDFTAGAPGWTLSDGASITGGGDPFALTGVPAQDSLSLPAGASAQSPFSCVDVTQPTFRFVAVGDAPASAVAVSVIYRQPLQGTLTLPVGTLTPGGTWQPSPQYQNAEVAGALLTGGTAQMALRFTAITGTTQLDDVFVDPRMSW